MVDTFRSGGIMMWPMLVVAIGIAVLAIRVAVDIRSRSARSADELGKTERHAPAVERKLQAILFWGGTAVLLGILGTVVGLVVMTQAIGLAGAVEPTLVWGGVGVSLVTLVFGLLIFLFASLAWFTLRQWALRSAA